MDTLFQSADALDIIIGVILFSVFAGWFFFGGRPASERNSTVSTEQPKQTQQNNTSCMALIVMGGVVAVVFGILAVIALPSLTTAYISNRSIPAIADRPESPIHELPSDDEKVTIPAGQLRALLHDQQYHDEEMAKLVRDVAISGDASQTVQGFFPIVCLGLLILMGVIFIFWRSSRKDLITFE